MGRPARGVRAMTLAKGDYLVGVEIVHEDNLILSISENGFGKRTPVNEYRETARGAKGVTLMKTTPRIGKVMQVLCVGEEVELVIITQNGNMISHRIEPHSPGRGRSTQRVKLVSLEEGDRVAAASVIPDDTSRTNGSNGSGELPLQ